MKRILKNFASTTTISLLVILLLSYGRSNLVNDAWQFSRHGELWEIASRDGTLVLDNVPQTVIESQAHARILDQVNALVRASEAICSQSLQHGADYSQVRPDVSAAIAELYRLREEQQAIFARLRLLGYVPDIDQPVFSGMGARFADDARDHVKIHPIIMKPNGDPAFLRIPTPSPAATVVSYEIPYAIPVLLLIPFPLLRFIRILQSRLRSRRGLCITCGYDLRGGHDRCPECGSPVPAGCRKRERDNGVACAGRSR